MTHTRARMLVICIVAILGLVLPPASLAAPAIAAEWTYVVGARLGLRVHSEPGLTTDITLVLYNGEDVRVEGDAVYAEGLWWRQVRVERRSGEFAGWVAAAHLANYEQQDSEEGPESSPVYIVTARLGLNLRASAGLNGAVVCIVPTGTRLSATDSSVREANGLVWREFSLGDGTVWAVEAFLQAP